MSEKIKEIPSTTKVHTFFCDDCGVKLMESEEYKGLKPSSPTSGNDDTHKEKSPKDIMLTENTKGAND